MNTSFFHLRANQRKKCNKISKLKKLDDSFAEVEDEMANLSTTFYMDLYTSEGMEDMDHLLDSVPTKVTATMNDDLLKLFCPDEVKSALFQMFPTKALGPDSFLLTSSSVTVMFVGRR
jgi:hypothetical protein